MLRRSGLDWLSLFAGLSLLVAAAVFTIELVLYSLTLTTLPPGLSLGSVPVGGLTEAQAQEQLDSAFFTPLELHYLDQVILLEPAVVNFQVNTAAMLSDANLYRTGRGFWSGFWDYLWLKPGQVQDIPLRFTYSRDKLRTYLADLAARYDHPGSAPRIDVGTLGFIAGEPGHHLDETAAISAIDAGLHSPSARLIVLPVTEQSNIRPSFETLADLLHQDVRKFQFDGLYSVYLTDLDTGQELTAYLSNGQPISGPVAVSGMSTIKIPIMVSFFIRHAGDLDETANLLLTRISGESQNPATDSLLEIIGGGTGFEGNKLKRFEGTRQVTADLQRLGLNNTYLSGLLDDLGAVLTPLVTPANSRTDFTTQPDPYNQTTAEDMGALLAMIYQCSKGGGALVAAFPEKITAPECRTIIDLMINNQVGPILISGGSPEGVVAHKHGWDFVPLHNVADAALVFTPNGKYALALYLYRSEPLVFDDFDRIVISSARAIYNFYNQPVQ